jgi:hypothetical protein
LLALAVLLTGSIASAADETQERLRAILRGSHANPDQLLELASLPREVAMPRLITILKDETAFNAARAEAAKRAVMLLPDSERYLAVKLAELATTVNETAGAAELMQGINKRKQAETDIAKVRILINQWDAAQERYRSGTDAQSEFASLVGAIASLRNDAAVRLIAPYVGSNSKDIDQLCISTPSLERAAAAGLYVLRFRGVELPNPPSTPDVPAWREWWQTARPGYTPGATAESPAKKPGAAKR